MKVIRLNGPVQPPNRAIAPRTTTSKKEAPLVKWWEWQITGQLWGDGTDRHYKKYKIESVFTGDKYIITSTNIRLEVKPLHFSDIVTNNLAEMNARILRWRAAKSKDDKLAYGRTTVELGLESRRSKSYFATEQHMVWAVGASARTGCRIPPEFFLENEGFGGTAGNGPEVLPGGNIGEPMSTIAMGHDTDWMIGRLWGKGPLGGLKSINAKQKYQLTRMGSAGLFPAMTVNQILAREQERQTRTEIRRVQPYGVRFVNTIGDERATNRRIDQLLDQHGSGANSYRKHELFLNAGGERGWSVKYTREYQKMADKLHERILSTAVGSVLFGPVGTIGGNLGSSTMGELWRHYTWDGKRTLSGKQDVFVHCVQRAPGYEAYLATKWSPPLGHKFKPGLVKPIPIIRLGG